MTPVPGEGRIRLAPTCPPQPHATAESPLLLRRNSSQEKPPMNPQIDGWWLFLMCIPVVNVIVNIIVNVDLARKFGKGAGFGIGLLLFPVICFPIIGFGGSQ
jgi:Family of unknown function (DUF5684)